VLDVDLATATISELKRLNGLKFVVLLGGEPGLLPTLTHRLGTVIREFGLGLRVETNASWASDPDAAEAFLAPLCELDASVMLSVDAFHEPFVPVQRVACALRALDRLGGRYNLEVPYMDFPAARHALDVRTNELLCELDRLMGRSPCARIFRGPVYFKGRAAHVLAPSVAAGRGVPGEVCDVVPWWSKGSQRTLELLALDPGGWLSKECGIAIGNVRERPVGDILRGFDAEAHPVLSTLIRSGPLGLAQKAAELGYVTRPDYADKCHLCQEARESLRSHYPDLLVPDIHYVEAEAG
jgi:hypothetical protein